MTKTIYLNEQQIRRDVAICVLLDHELDARARANRERRERRERRTQGGAS